MHRCESNVTLIMYHASVCGALLWVRIVGGNILPGCVMIIFFKWLFAMSGQQDMVYIFVMIVCRHR